MEKEVLIDFLRTVPIEHNTDIVGNYSKLFGGASPGILLTDLVQRKYFLRVKSDLNPDLYSDCSINVGSDRVQFHCDCNTKYRAMYCNHIVYAAIYVLVRALKVDFKEIVAEAQLNRAKESAVSAAPDPETAGAPIVQAKETINPLSYSGWRSIKSQPANLSYAVYAVDYRNSSRDSQSRVTVLDFDEATLTARFTYKKSAKIVYEQKVKYDAHQTFFYWCSCTESVAVCPHVKTALEVFLMQRGKNFFSTYKDRTEEKNQLLAPYGITIADSEANDFKFVVDSYDRITLKPPTWLWKADVTETVTDLQKLLQKRPTGQSFPLFKADIVDFEIGVLLNLTSQHFKVGFEIDGLKIFEAGKKKTFKKLPIHDPANFSLLQTLPEDIFNALLRVNDAGVKLELIAKGFQHVYYYSNPYQQLTEASTAALRKYLVAEVIKMWPLLCGFNNVYVLKSGSFAAANLKPAQLSPSKINFRFIVSADEKYITIRLVKEKDGQEIPNAEVKVLNGFLLEVNDYLHVTEDAEDISLLSRFEYGFVKIPVSSTKMVIQQLIPLLEKKYQVEVPDSLYVNKIATEPQYQILLREMDGKYLVLQPQFVYDDTTFDYSLNPENHFRATQDGKYELVERDLEKEQLFFNSLKALHPRFEKATLNPFFFVPFEETMQKNWFIETIRQLNDNNIKVLGLQDLTRHKYNTNKPVWEMKAGSGIDWFDLQIEVSFGDQVVPIRDVRKAFMNKQNVVVLGDGSFGILPEEWITQYGMLLKLGDEQKDGALRINKLHYTLIDELHSQINDEDILREISEKKQKLQLIGNIKTVKPHKDIKATLRPYQLTGFQWMQTLDELGWGGCLADDMGLGKTLQAITFLHFLKLKYKGSTHLVICPTSLIYNWENELKKFAPTLKYHIYYGLEREISEAHFNDYDVIITSYGIIRNDVEEFMKFQWHYIILDESQAIKNPEAQTNKALQLLKSKNRMILSGTPIQNNTFDLFAQFHFINPGLLGNKEFFKTEFANPIDKNNDNEKSGQLRRLIFPFMLRRTKEQVATDLPAKTETILWCEMGKDQRTVYNDYKNYYRNTLLEKIEEVGMAKAGMYVLEGLLRLRQICDSPQLVKDNEVTTTKSIKIEELLREIEENAGGHKLLVFSQFTEMLHLIEDNLRKEKVSYVYLDGSTPAEKRKESVDIFQNQPDVRVFLISLKAGGVGLNLTAADYVYIVDPWWNPAVEQQAIDRTHRIGQTNPIFAYKMICKDTVEEKIVQLQQRKKQLANELVTEDAGFIKKLTKDDVAFLFS